MAHNKPSSYRNNTVTAKLGRLLVTGFMQPEHRGQIPSLVAPARQQFLVYPFVVRGGRNRGNRRTGGQTERDDYTLAAHARAEG